MKWRQHRAEPVDSLHPLIEHVPENGLSAFMALPDELDSLNEAVAEPIISPLRKSNSKVTFMSTVLVVESDQPSRRISTVESFIRAHRHLVCITQETAMSLARKK